MRRKMCIRDSFDRDVHKHVGTTFAHAQAAHPAEGELLGESLFQGLGMFLAAPVKQHGHGPAGEPEAHNDDDARNEKRGDCLLYTSMGCPWLWTRPSPRRICFGLLSMVLIL